MKNIFRILMAVAVLFTASCAKEDISSTIASGEANVTFTVDLPELGTRAENFGKGASATTLRYYVYDGDNYLPAISSESLPEKMVTLNGGKATVTLPLIKGMTYNIIFWADNGSNIYTIDPATKVLTVNYTNAKANDDSRDAFYKYVPAIDPATATNEDTTIVLTRPFAQLNAATNDLTAVANSGVVLNTLTSKVTVKNAYTTLNLVDGTVGNPTQVTFAATAIPAKLDTPETLKDGYDYLSMNYVLVNTKELVEATLTVYGERTTGGEAFPLTVNNYTNVPLQRNYRTNILGSLITKATEFEVTINADWEDKEKYVLAGGEVTLTENLVANNIVVKEDTVLNLNGYNVESGIEYVAGLTGTDIAAITIENGATLTIIGEGTIKGTTYGVYAKDGNLIIKGGNYIAGTSAVQVANATVNIEGGTFKTTGTDKRYVINCLDADYKAGRAVVKITGGTFEGFNPANNAAEGQGTNFVVNGYCALESNGSFTVSKGYPIYVDNAETTIVDGVIGLEIDAENNITTYGVSSANGLKWISEQIDGALAHTAEKAYEVNGNTIKLLADIDLAEYDANGEPICFEPIGNYKKEIAFTGVFDGDGHTIKNLNQNTWALDWGYNYSTGLGMGLFSCVEDATIKNLTMDNASISGDSALCGIVAATAYGDCTFENITVKNSQCNDYQYMSGGIVGWASGNHEYIKCNVDASTTIGGQWGDFGNSNGGIIGRTAAKATIYMKDCNVACRIDAVNDVVSAYQYYAYRCCGMLIGNTNNSQVINETPYAAAPNLTCENVTVTYGTWMNYHYCKFAGTGYPYVRVESGVSVDAYVNIRYGHPTDANGNTVVDHNHVHNDGEDHHICLPFDQLLGGGPNGDGRNPVYGLASFPGVTVVYPAEYTCDLCGQKHNVQ